MRGISKGSLESVLDLELVLPHQIAPEAEVVRLFQDCVCGLTRQHGTVAAIVVTKVSPLFVCASVPNSIRRLCFCSTPAAVTVRSTIARLRKFQQETA